MAHAHELSIQPRSDLMRTCILIVTSLSVLAAVEPPDATQPVPAPVAQATPAAQTAFLRSLAQSPAVQAAQERILASRRVAGAAGRLPDPMLTAGYARKTTSMERWPMYDAMLEQALPRWGERDAMRAKASAETAMSEAELQEALGETAAEVAAMLAEADAARAKLALVEGQIARATSLQATIAARVAAGTAAIAATGCEEPARRPDRRTRHHATHDHRCRAGGPRTPGHAPNGSAAALHRP